MSSHTARLTELASFQYQENDEQLLEQNLIEIRQIAAESLEDEEKYLVLQAYSQIAHSLENAQCLAVYEELFTFSKNMPSEKITPEIAEFLIEVRLHYCDRYRIHRRDLNACDQFINELNTKENKTDSECAAYIRLHNMKLRSLDHGEEKYLALSAIKKLCQQYEVRLNNHVGHKVYVRVLESCNNLRQSSQFYLPKQLDEINSFRQYILSFVYLDSSVAPAYNKRFYEFSEKLNDFKSEFGEEEFYDIAERTYQNEIGALNNEKVAELAAKIKKCKDRLDEIDELGMELLSLNNLPYNAALAIINQYLIMIEDYLRLKDVKSVSIFEDVVSLEARIKEKTLARDKVKCKLFIYACRIDKLWYEKPNNYNLLESAHEVIKIFSDVQPSIKTQNKSLYKAYLCVYHSDETLTVDEEITYLRKAKIYAKAYNKFRDREMGSYGLNLHLFRAYIKKCHSLLPSQNKKLNKYIKLALDSLYKGSPYFIMSNYHTDILSMFDFLIKKNPPFLEYLFYNALRIFFTKPDDSNESKFDLYQALGDLYKICDDIAISSSRMKLDFIQDAIKLMRIVSEKNIYTTLLHPSIKDYLSNEDKRKTFETYINKLSYHANLLTSLETFKKEISTLQDENKKMTQKIEQLEQRNLEHDSEVADLKNQISQLQMLVAPLSARGIKRENPNEASNSTTRIPGEPEAKRAANATTMAAQTICTASTAVFAINRGNVGAEASDTPEYRK